MSTIKIKDGDLGDKYYEVDGIGTMASPFKASVKTSFKNTANIDSGGRLRVSQITTLFDGKILNSDDTNLFGNVGTGTGLYQNSTYKMSVTSGQYLIRSSKFYLPYFSGKSQMIEMTFDNFQTQTNVIKRVGYFSSNAVAPYDSNKDGFWLENDGTGISLKIENNGTSIANVPLASFNGYADIATYDWSKFTVINFDFLWLGGANFRVFLVVNNSFVLSHEFMFSGVFTGTIFKSPNQTLRYEIRSTTGVGYLTSICSQVATEGSNIEGGKVIGIFNTTGIACNNVGTIYALKSWKKQPTNRDIAIEILDLGITRTATADSGITLLIQNPTLSAPITYANKSRFQEGSPTTQTITPNTGRVLNVFPVGEPGASNTLKESYLSFLSIDIADTPDEYVLAYIPITTNQTIYGTVNLKEY